MPDIVLYDRTGAAVTYEGVEELVVDTPDEVKGAKFSYGEIVENVEVPLALADGNQTVVVPDGYLAKSAVILKPDTLVPEYIKKNIEIAGVVGDFAGDEAEKTVELNMADGDQVIEADEDTVLTKVTVLKPETLVPENIAKGITIAGVLGTAAISQFDVTDELLKYFAYNIDNEARTIILCTVNYSKLYADNGNYDVNIPDKIGGYDVLIDA